MPIKRAPYQITASHAHRTATAFREAARAADRGEALGGGITLLMHDNKLDSRLVGLLDTRRELACKALLRFLIATALDDD